jgi:hypothetical protein
VLVFRASTAGDTATASVDGEVVEVEVEVKSSFVEDICLVNTDVQAAAA